MEQSCGFVLMMLSVLSTMLCTEKSYCFKILFHICVSFHTPSLLPLNLTTSMQCKFCCLLFYYADTAGRNLIHSIGKHHLICPTEPNQQSRQSMCYKYRYVIPVNPPRPCRSKYATQSTGHFFLLRMNLCKVFRIP